MIKIVSDLRQDGGFLGYSGFQHEIVRITLNVIVSNAPKCPLKNDVCIVQNLVKLSNTSTMLLSHIAKTVSNLVEVFESLTTSF